MLGMEGAEPGPQETGGASGSSTYRGRAEDGRLLGTGRRSREGQAATAPQGRQGERGASWEAARGCLSRGENMYGGRRGRSGSRVNRGNGFISVNAAVSLCGQFRGRWIQ